jgi:hypothetical protein
MFSWWALGQLWLYFSNPVAVVSLKILRFICHIVLSITLTYELFTLKWHIALVTVLAYLLRVHKCFPLLYSVCHALCLLIRCSQEEITSVVFSISHLQEGEKVRGVTNIIWLISDLWTNLHLNNSLRDARLGQFKGWFWLKIIICIFCNLLHIWWVQQTCSWDIFIDLQYSQLIFLLLPLFSGMLWFWSFIR